MSYLCLDDGHRRMLNPSDRVLHSRVMNNGLPTIQGLSLMDCASVLCTSYSQRLQKPLFLISTRLILPEPQEQQILLLTSGQNDGEYVPNDQRR